MHVINHHGLIRIAIIDFDAHNGNGTIDVLKEDERVVVSSSFQHPYYPNCHFDTLVEHLIFTPLNAGAGGIHFRTKGEQDFFPPIDAFKSQLILIPAGFDVHPENPLDNLNLVEDDYRWITTMIKDTTDRYFKSRIVSMLEGGYHLEALGCSVCAHIEMMLYD